MKNWGFIRIKWNKLENQILWVSQSMDFKWIPLVFRSTYPLLSVKNMYIKARSSYQSYWEFICATLNINLSRARELSVPTPGISSFCHRTRFNWRTMKQKSHETGVTGVLVFLWLLSRRSSDKPRQTLMNIICTLCVVQCDVSCVETKAVIRGSVSSGMMGDTQSIIC